jgi:glycosyltransferase involved in cell wall biosynthesis
MNKQQSTNKPPIAIIAPHFSHGGGVLSSLKVVYEFCEQYFSPKIYSLSFLPDTAMSLRSLRFTSTTREKTYEGMRCVEIGARWSRWEPGHYWFTRRLWKRHLGAYRYVFVLGGTPHIAHPAVILNKTFILWLASTYLDDRIHRLAQASVFEKIMHHAQAPFMEAIEQQILKKAAILLPMSTYTKGLCEKIAQMPFDNARVCPVPVSLHEVVEKEHVAPFRIISVARFIDARKNFRMLLAVCEKLLEEDSRFSFDIVGVYPERIGDVLRLQTRFGDRIIFHGFIKPDRLQSLYQQAFLALITSDQEGLGIAGLDALSWGVPVISTHCGGVTDYVVPGLSGLLVEPGAVREMVERVRALAGDPKTYALMCKGALSVVHSRFSKQAVFIKFQWALTRAYPELGALFARDDEQEVVSEDSDCGTCVSVFDQPRKVGRV